MAVSGVSRRIEKAIEAYLERDYESCLIQYFPALDKTAKKRRPKAGVGTRIKGFLEDEIDIISDVALGSRLNITNDGLSISDVLYKYARTSVVHEGELDSRITFNESIGLIASEDWCLNTRYILGLILAVILAPENYKEALGKEISFNIRGRSFRASELWGEREMIITHMNSFYKDERR